MLVLYVKRNENLNCLWITSFASVDTDTVFLLGVSSSIMSSFSIFGRSL